MPLSSLSHLSVTQGEPWVLSWQKGEPQPGQDRPEASEAQIRRELGKEAETWRDTVTEPVKRREREAEKKMSEHSHARPLPTRPDWLQGRESPRLQYLFPHPRSP